MSSPEFARTFQKATAPLIIGVRQLVNPYIIWMGATTGLLISLVMATLALQYFMFMEMRKLSKAN